MFIKEIIINNFKIYYQRNEIIFQKDKNRNIFIISGQNGYGKTTLLTALVWCLYGQNIKDVDNNFRKNIIESGGYKTFAFNNLNRAAKVEGQSIYSVEIVLADIEFPAIPLKEISITRIYDTKKANETLRILIDGKDNELTKEVGPEIFINDFILPKEIAKFFFFDSEKIVEFADIRSIEEKRNLSKAYSEVLGIKKYEDLRENLLNLRLRFIKDSSGDEGERDKIDFLEQEISEYKNMIDINSDKIKVLEEEKEIKRKSLRYFQEKIIKEGASNSIEKVIDAKKQKEELSTKFMDLNHELKEMLDLAPFAIAFDIMSTIRNQVEEESEHDVTNKYNGLLKSNLKVIRKDIKNMSLPLGINKNSRMEIKKRFYDLLVKRILSDNENKKRLNEISKLHFFTDSEKGELSALLNNIKHSFKTKFEDLGIRYKETKININKLNRFIIDSENKENDPVVRDIRAKMKINDGRILEIEKEVSEINSVSNYLKNQIAIKQNVISSISKKISLNDEAENKDKIVERLIRRLDEFILRLKNAKKVSLEKRLLENLNSLMHKKHYIRSVKVYVESDILDIDLFDKMGNVIIKEYLSKGEQQLYATALLKSLVEESNISFPVFIDSPLQKFDFQHTKNIIKKFYPYISEQVVLLPLIEKELNRDEMLLLDTRINVSFVIDNISSDCSKIKQINKDELLEYFQIEENRLYV